jgi:PST family polysaccharide transporter
MSSYRQIFKSTALIGATEVANIGIGVIRNKVLAVLLGTSGFGLAGTYLTLTGFVGGVTGLGLGMSGVRQIAEASAGGDQAKLARTTKALRWASLLAGILGMLVLLALCVPLSHYTFGDGAHVWGIAIMSLSLLFGGISTGQFALLQGLRRLADFGKSQVAGAFFGMLASIAVVFFLREDGVAVYLVANAGMAVIFSWWYARKVELPPVSLRLKEKWRESRGLIALGFAFLLQNLVLGLGAYLSRVFIISQLDLAAVGLFTATWTLSNYYVNMVLKAMGADFYPRVTAAANDHQALNRLINEQIEMGLLIAVPGVLAVMALSPLALQILYSSAFVEGTDIIRWQILGVVMQVASWPIAFIQLAKGKGKVFVGSEIVSAVAGLGCLIAGLHFWKLEGIGMSVAASGLLMFIYYIALGRRLSGFAFSKNSRQVVALSMAAVIAGFLAVRLLPSVWGMAAGLALAIATAAASVWALQRLLNINAWLWLKKKSGLAKNDKPGGS